ncbi:lytic transglycosylase domain-containing protein [Paenibacillus sp. GD4]|uniref:lytic transglycosylase domain-containing protein n=1 Tax=Paenibacillus sp. GD4 TaxID=3068890 RepID=UPI0027965AD5|nr:lytic transglycosylase domain-containing protein [Paenibacillus sp. GD4]MDQ1909974.1 lytic transglycosylase domain-containing protein [Paenibacillus sp. GD4]
MKFFRKKRTFAFLLVGFVIFLFLSSGALGRMMYPIHYQEEIRENAARYELDPFLIAAIIRVESNYEKDIESKKGAYGLMQLMPDTSSWIIETGQFSPSYGSALDNPAVSIQLGSWYLNWLHKQFQGNPYAAIAGYNAGQGNVIKWLQSKEWDGTLENAAMIPFGETRHYVQRVVYYQKRYEQLYGDHWNKK